MAMRRSLLLPLIVACALFIENLDGTVLSTSLPAIARDLHVDPIALKLALTSYLVSLSVFIPISGWVADRFGARTTFASAIAVFMLGSVCCAFSGSLEEFVAARFLQGIGGAMMVPVGRLVLLRSIPKSELVAALNNLTMPALVGPVLGPPLGGLITTYTHWSYIFLINLPIGALGIWLTLKYLPNLREPDVGKLDRLGFVYSGLGLAASMLGFATLWEHMLSPTASAICVGVGVTGVVLYIRHALGHEHPLLDLRLFRVATFRAGVAGGALFRVGQGAVPFLLPLMLQLTFGLSPLESGLLTFASAVGALFMKALSRHILKRLGFRTVLVFNSVFAAGLIASYGSFGPDTPRAFIMPVLLLGGCLTSLQFTSLNAIAYADVSQREMSQATSLASVVQQIALSFGVTIAAYALQVAQTARSEATLTRADFAIAFVVVSGIAVCSSLVFRTLTADAGAELSGRKQAVAESETAAHRQA